MSTRCKAENFLAQAMSTASSHSEGQYCFAALIRMGAKKCTHPLAGEAVSEHGAILADGLVGQLERLRERRADRYSGGGA